jgi:hypothetical protein
MEGKGSYGAIFSKPRFPFYIKYNFDKIKIIEDDNLDKLMTNNEVSKIFYDIDFYYDERNNYLEILKYELPDIFFNKPLNYGIININLVINSLVYTSKWAGNNEFKKIIDNCYYQITFPRGILIYKNIFLSIEEFYAKSFNLLNFVKYLNDNNFIYDDFKISNLLEVNNIYKISDFSSLMKINSINKDIFNESYLSICSYYIYLPILNNIIYKYFNNINKKYFDEYIFNESKDYINLTLDNIINNMNDYILNINFTDVNNNKIEINILDILNEIKKFRKKNNNNDLYLEKFTEYLNNKYNNDMFKILEDLSKRINIYSLGIIILNVFNCKKNFLYNEFKQNIFYDKLLELISYCCLNFMVINNNVYIFDPNIDFIINSYNEIINLNT